MPVGGSHPLIIVAQADRQHSEPVDACYRDVWQRHRLNAADPGSRGRGGSGRRGRPGSGWTSPPPTTPGRSRGSGRASSARRFRPPTRRGRSRRCCSCQECSSTGR
ncbi:hypothetical protein D3248_03940 [Leucobacter zeae]|nr:hypothetical protein [Leucobacter zeae]